MNTMKTPKLEDKTSQTHEKQINANTDLETLIAKTILAKYKL